MINSIISPFSFPLIPLLCVDKPYSRKNLQKKSCLLTVLKPPVITPHRLCNSISYLLKYLRFKCIIRVYNYLIYRLL